MGTLNCAYGRRKAIRRGSVRLRALRFMSLAPSPFCSPCFLVEVLFFRIFVLVFKKLVFLGIDLMSIVASISSLSSHSSTMPNPSGAALIKSFVSHDLHSQIP